MTKTVALLGGSFNPPHEGHFGMASYIQQSLAVDETWMLFSQNVEKDPKTYVSLEHRMNMAQILARHYDPRIVLSDEEAKIADRIGRNDTYYILEELKIKFPENKFIFVMGADTFSRFDGWKERDDILNSTIVAIVDRPGFREAALNSPTAIAFADQMIDITDPKNLENADHGWCFMNNPLIDTSSTDIKARISCGETCDNGPFGEVLAYIHEHGLYGTVMAATETPKHHLKYA